MIGQLDQNVLEALLETLPVEFSLVDHNDKVLAWNKHETRIFKRPKNVVGRNVQDCHPKGSLDKVEKILSEWNPLGDKADEFEDLDNYKTEAIDIIFHLNANFYGWTPTETVLNVLNSAFKIKLTKEECKEPCDNILKAIEKYK